MILKKAMLSAGGGAARTAAATTTRCDDAAPPAAPPLPPPLPGSEKDAPPPPPPAAGDASAADDAIAQAAKMASMYANPGPYEQASFDARRLIQLDTFDGFRCDINKQVSPFVAAVHSFWLGTSMINDGTNRTNTYTFTTQVADDAGIVMGRFDPGRVSLDGQVHRALLGGLAMGKIQFMVSAEGQSDQMFTELNFGGHTWTGNLKYGSVAGGLMYGCNYFQAITPRVALGGEGIYVGANQSLISNYTLKLSFPAKTGEEGIPIPTSPKLEHEAEQQGPPGMPQPESAGSSSFCINVNPSQAACQINYKRVVTPQRVTLGAELQFNPLSLESQMLAGAEFKLQRSKMNVCIDGGLRIQTLLEAKLGIAPGSPSLSFSAEMNHPEDQMRFGYGITIDG